MDKESIERAIDRRTQLLREKADAEEKLLTVRTRWARAAAEGNAPQEENLNILINEAKDVIRSADFKIRALEDLEVSPGRSLLSVIETEELRQCM